MSSRSRRGQRPARPARAGRRPLRPVPSAGLPAGLPQAMPATAAGDPPAADVGNRFLGAYPYALLVSTDGRGFLLTIRHAGTTLTIPMRREELGQWAEYLAQSASGQQPTSAATRLWVPPAAGVAAPAADG